MPILRKTHHSTKDKTDKRVREAALALIRKDRDLDDAKYTPPGAIGHYVDGQRAPRGDSAG